ncbi:MAG: hypothetical protein K2X47_15940, partial [Bdellovibrionales bacterium]|nr:hypothetical protein [Bdellovibrionales bacterium]
MKIFSLWQKYFLLTLICALALIASGFYIFLNADKGSYAKYRNDAMVFAARIIEADQDSKERFKTFSSFVGNLDVYMFDFWIVNSLGQVIDHFGKSNLELNWAELPKPSEPLQLAEFKDPGPLFGRGLVGVI